MDALAQRVQAIEVDENFNPINGMKAEPVLPLADAARTAMADPDMAGAVDPDDLARCVTTALRFARKHLASHPQDPLGEEEIGAVHLYTQQTPLYAILNMRLRDREPLKPFRPYVK